MKEEWPARGADNWPKRGADNWPKRGRFTFGRLAILFAALVAGLWLLF